MLSTAVEREQQDITRVRGLLGRCTRYSDMCNHCYSRSGWSQSRSGRRPAQLRDQGSSQTNTHTDIMRQRGIRSLAAPWSDGVP